MYYPSFYYNYNYQIPSLNAQCLRTNEESMFREIKDDLSLIVEEVLDKYLNDSYLESEKDLFYHKIEAIVQDQANFIYQARIKNQVQNSVSFSPFQFYPYSSLINPSFNDSMQNSNYQNIFLPFHYPQPASISTNTGSKKNQKFITTKRKSKSKISSKSPSIKDVKRLADKGDIESIIKYGVMLR